MSIGINSHNTFKSSAEYDRSGTQTHMLTKYIVRRQITFSNPCNAPESERHSNLVAFLCDIFHQPIA